MAYPYRPQFFLKYPEYIPPTDEDDAQTDPRLKLEPPCRAKCKKYTKLYEECAERVIKRNQIYQEAVAQGRGFQVPGPGQCLGQHYDLTECVNNCIAKDLFRYLK